VMSDDSDEDITHDHNATAPCSIDRSQAMCGDDKSKKLSVTTSVSGSRVLSLDVNWTYLYRRP
jgi:hypothetical protein